MIQDTLSERRIARVPTRGVRVPALQSHFAALARNLQASYNDAGELAFAIGFTAGESKAGVSTVAVNLAICSSECSDRRVLLVDADIESGGLSDRLRLRQEGGLVDILRGEAPVEACLRELECAGSLTFLPVGAAGGSGVKCDRLASLIEELKERFDWIIVDLPPATELSPCLSLARALDGLLMVVRADRDTADSAVRAKERLMKFHVPVLGAILNGGR